MKMPWRRHHRAFGRKTGARIALGVDGSCIDRLRGGARFTSQLKKQGKDGKANGLKWLCAIPLWDRIPIQSTRARQDRSPIPQSTADSRTGEYRRKLVLTR